MQPEARLYPRAVLAYVILRVAVFIAGFAAEGVISLEIQTATFTAAAKSSVVEELLFDNDCRL